MRVVVDMDEVLAQFVSKVLRRWNAVQGTSFTREQVTGWRMEDVLGMDAVGKGHLIEEWMAEPGFFEDLEPVRDAVWGFNSLRSDGHDVIVATSIPEVATHAFDGKRRWMRRHFPDWSMKNFIACSRKGSIDCDVLIDDGAHNIEDWRPSFWKRAVVFDAPWNRDVPAGRYVRRATGWRQAIRLVDEQRQMFDLESRRAGGVTS